jgi:hypothetical protein
VEERREKREEKRLVRLQLVWAQESKKYVREIGGTCINCEELTIIYVGREKAVTVLTASLLAILLFLLLVYEHRSQY